MKLWCFTYVGRVEVVSASWQVSLYTTCNKLTSSGYPILFRIHLKLQYIEMSPDWLPDTRISGGYIVAILMFVISCNDSG